MAIETSGHCAMKENGYLDDGTYTAVKIVSLLARTMNDNGRSDASLLDLIASLDETRHTLWRYAATRLAKLRSFADGLLRTYCSLPFGSQLQHSETD